VGEGAWIAAVAAEVEAERLAGHRPRQMSSADMDNARIQRVMTLVPEAAVRGNHRLAVDTRLPIEPTLLEQNRQ
jgi:hypothetical protein